MAALRFFFDENLLHLGKAFAAVRKDVTHPGHWAIPEVPTGSKDPDWLPIVGAAGRDLIVVTLDKRIWHKPGEVKLITPHKIRMVTFTPQEDLNTWEKFCFVVNKWEKMEREIASRGAGPWIMTINKGGKVRYIPIP